MSTEINETNTEIALDDAVAHWERLSKCRTREEVMAEGYRDKSCALCKVFLKYSCRGCPVVGRTGLISCRGSPYSDASRALDSFVDGHCKTFPLKEVLAELNFLKSLRE